MKKILVKDIIPLETLLTLNKPTDAKIHFARFNGQEEPLDVFSRSQEGIKEWNEYKNERIRFHKYIFTLVKFYHERDTWLFAGVYRVLSNTGEKHEVELSSIAEQYIGRLKINYDYKHILGEPLLQKHFDGLEVKEILRERFIGREFSGFDNIHLSFSELENIFDREVLSWKSPLQNIKGVYLIMDKNNGKPYIGSAYEDKSGLWSRWEIYKNTGHGIHSRKLKSLIRENGIEYARKHFTFTLIESFPLNSDNSIVIKREQYWKDVFKTRLFGYNDN